MLISLSVEDVNKINWDFKIVRRDIAERGRDYASVLRRYNKFVKKDFEDYVKPFMKYADIIIPGGANNDSNSTNYRFFSRTPVYLWKSSWTDEKNEKEKFTCWGNWGDF